ncbi:hypothetical protein MJO28_007131 [Puccinia striiformis f. sp. tritici]|uniref:Uncharacterized protein n=3 Tax=Puccinia striiformis TaxID=27350 RepID=A0A0L0VRT1_9BASI|nr:hypothetical protein Pst134EA_013225 [Puccinia striiformis f. sp. tritici]KAI9622789.1 hypothetical protein H4Q26_015073 [Puccinia striiformis f. sp. tritici PST-130]KNF01932.1 hypothetical protein PSTG_04757 [Puccinia striiformis f. sp. tritici PST-78]POW22275.1 hypothetical protein PSHT_01381 [Puccinia striiformis]KAH9454138.1 hypothetical protein Pst134EB_014234 [Puccinia striiformis f. sp. tritici]KAH9465336.1 hypothetical protein Pst134EA_013225 [Puccinia striiformis f. sp. tritici]
MSPLIIDHFISLENLKFNFARPQALYETHSSSPSGHLITAKNVVILIDIIIVVVISLLLLLGYFLYRRQMRRKEDFTKSFETSEAKIAQESNQAAIGYNSPSASTIAAEEESTHEKL